MRGGWLLGGDFNDIMVATDKRGGAPNSIQKRNLFKDRINSCNLMDIESLGNNTLG